MFPSSGYFRSITCPYFNNGLCERPHCHFRHVKPDTVQVLSNLTRSAVEINASVSSQQKILGDDGKPDLLALVREAILQVQKEVEEDKIKSSTVSNTSHKLATNGEHNVTICRTSPTDVVKGSKELSKKENGPCKQPEYKPTPIAELKKLQDHQKGGSSLEYDPTERYNPGTSKHLDSTEYKPSKISHSTEPKKKTKKTIEYVPTKTSFESKAKKTSIPEQSSDDDRNSNVEANFSDDNEDDGSAKKFSKRIEPTPTETAVTAKTNTGASNFDLVNMILTESKMCDTFISAASARKESQFKPKDKVNKTTTLSKVKPISQNSQKSTPSQTKKEPDKSLKKKSSSSLPSSSNKTVTSKHSASTNETSKTKVNQQKTENKIKARVEKIDGSKNNHSASKKSSSNTSKTSGEKKTSSKPVKENVDHSKSKTVKESVDQSKSKTVKENVDHSKSKTVKENVDHSKSKTVKENTVHSKSKTVKESRSPSKTKHDDTTVKKTKKPTSEVKNTSKSLKPHSSKHKSGSSSKHKLSPDKHKTTPVKKKKLSESESKTEKDKNKLPTGSQSPFPIKSSSLYKSPISRTSKSSEGEMSSSPQFISDDLDTDLDEHDTYEECLRIFNEYVPETGQENLASLKKSVATAKAVADEVEPYHTGKKRIAHDAGTAPQKKPKMLPHAQPAPSLTMHNRLLQLQKMMQESQKTLMEPPVAIPQKLQSPPPKISSTSTFLSTVNISVTSGKKRIAHVPSGLPVGATQFRLDTTQSPAPSTCNNSDDQTNQMNTIAHTVTKGSTRVAHVPAPTTLKRPIIISEYGSRVPVNIRQRYLNLLIDECLKIYDCEQDAFDRSLAEESNSYDRSSTRTVYLNVVANTIKRLRNEREGIIPLSSISRPDMNNLPTSSSTPSSSVPKARPVLPRQMVSHEFNLGGKRAANVSYSIERSKHKVGDMPLMGVKLYRALQQYILTPKQLEDNGFPVPHPTDPNKVVILKHDTRNPKKSDSLGRICGRCGAGFKVNSKGVYITEEECVYHWGRPYKVRSAGSLETRYSCCSGGSHSEGCCVARLHVYDDFDHDNLKGFVKTLPKSPPLDGNCGVYALDCEMCYTNMGSELTRVTVIGSDMKPVFESLVKPENPVVDYNTRFSGITEEDLSPVKTTIRDVQAVILSLFSDKTILIGHSLESDFRALKLVHHTVVDTSVVYPHRLGPPYKRALRNLSAEYLKKIIQNGLDGHDSQEDAAACMELMLLKVKEDLKKTY